MKFHFVTVVWNDSYTDLFLKVVLPGQLSAGNLPYFSNNRRAVYKIYTTSEDAERIKESPVFVKLKDIISTEIVLIDDIDEIYLKDFGLAYTYEAVSECEKQAINSAVDDKAVFVLLPPDVVWADGALLNLEKIALTGKRAVLVAGMSVAKETFVPVFLERFHSKKDLTATISSRELVRLALDHLHPGTNAFFWNFPKFANSPSSLFWRVGDEGILIRGFHLHPLMTMPYKQIASISPTIDGGNYLSIEHPDPDDLYIVEDSDEIVGIEISNSEQFRESLYNKSSVFKVAYWAKYNANFYHRIFLRHKIRIHTSGISSRWEEVEKHSNKVVNLICFLLRFKGLLNIISVIEYLSAKNIVSTGRKLLGGITSVPDIMLFVARIFLHMKFYPQSVFWLSRYMDSSGKKCDYEKVYKCACQLQQYNSHLYAEQVFEKLREKKYCPWAIYFHLGEIYYWFRKDKSEAKGYFEKALKIYPEHEKAKRYLEVMNRSCIAGAGLHQGVQKNKMIKVLYAGFLPVFSSAGSHPQFHHITTPPPGYEFVQTVPGSMWKRVDLLTIRVASALSADRIRTVDLFKRIWGKRVQSLAGKVKSDHFADFSSRYELRHIDSGNIWGLGRLMSSTINLLSSVKGNRARLYDFVKFIMTRDLLAQMEIPMDVKLVFLPSYPYILGQVPWIIEIEEPATLFTPFVLHEETSSLQISNVPCYPFIKTLLESDVCRGIVCHVKSTAEGIPLLFRNDKLRDKIYHVPLGIQSSPGLFTKREKNKKSTRILFTNSWHQAPRSFYLRGGLDLLEAFSVVASRFPNVQLILRTVLPSDLDYRYVKIIKDCPIEIVDKFLSSEQMQDIMLSADIYVLPSARLHVVSILQAMAHGLAVIVSDGWGITEYVEDGENGMVVRGRYGKCSWMDENGMLREDYSSLFSTDPSFVSGLVNAMSVLIEDRDLRDKLARSAREDIETKFSMDSWNQALASVFDKALYRER